MPDAAAALRRWVELLDPDDGRLVLVEGKWHTGAGLTADQARLLLAHAGRDAVVSELDDPALWGKAIADERYLVISTR